MANPEQNPTKNGQKLHHMRYHAPAEVLASRAHAPRTASICHTPHVPVPRSPTRSTRLLCFTSCHVSPRWRHTATSSVDRWLWPLTVDFNQSQKFSTGPVLLRIDCSVTLCLCFGSWMSRTMIFESCKDCGRDGGDSLLTVTTGWRQG